MINHLSTIFLIINLLLLIKYEIVQTQTIKTSKETCVGNRLETISTDNLQVCYINDISNKSILVWFTIGESLNKIFDSYRFILRLIDNSLSTNSIAKILTNFTEVIDLNNSLRMFNLDSGQYEVCIEFQSNLTTFIYQLRDGCIPIRIGKSSHESSKQNPTPILIALAISIVLFFILGLVVQWGKEKRRKRSQDDNKPRTRSSSILSTISFKQQRERFVRNLFHRHIDKPRVSRMRQWARNRAFRHRISAQEQEFEKPRTLRKWSRHFFTSTDQSLQPRSRSETVSRDRTSSFDSILTTNNIYTISENEQHQMPPKKPSFHLSIPEEYSML